MIDSKSPAHKTVSKNVTRSWSYPFTLCDPKAPNDMRSHFIALSAMEIGFFPIAASGFPNGSIHVGKACHGFAIDDGFRCLADGDVVAYRLDDMHQILRYEDESVLRYSAGFVLVRHRMALPSTGTPDALTPSLDTSITGDRDGDGDGDGTYIFSLYTYNRPLARYPTDRDGFLEVSLPFWQGTRKFRVGTRAKDTQVLPPVVVPRSVWTSFGSVIHEAETEVAAEPPPALAVGLRVRSRGASSGEVIGLLPRGCILTVHGTAIQGWAQIARIERGAPLSYAVGEPAPANITQGWVFLGELDSTILPAPVDTVVVLDEPYPVKAGERIGFLGENPGKAFAQKNGGVQTPDPRVAIEVFAGNDFPAYLAESRSRAGALPDNEKTILVIERGAKLCRFPHDPEHIASPDHRIVPDPGAPISGPFVYGRLFRLDTQAPLLPLEPGQLYGDYLRTKGHERVSEAAFRKLSAARKADYPLREVLTPVDIGPCWGQLPPKRYVAAWTTPPLVAADADAAVGFEYTFSRADLDGLHETRRFVDRDGTHWWQVEVTGDDHKALYAWVSDRNHPNTHWESPYAWPGFNIADGTMFEPMEALQRFVCVTGEVHPIHEESFAPVAAALNRSEMVAALETAIDHAGTLDGKVTAKDIAHARRTPSLARGLSRVIARFQSQWSHDVERWVKLAPLMDTDWPVEMERQRKRGWWKEVAGKVDGFPDDPHVHHIHPFGWVDNFSVTPSLLGELRVRAFLRVIRFGEGTSDEDGYRRIFSGVMFTSFASHPNRAITSSGLTSTAAGAYQFLERTWRAVAKKLSLPDFSPQSQDVAAIYLLGRRHALKPIVEGRLIDAICGSGAKHEGANKEWASQPESPYGQPVMSMEKAESLFAEYLIEEQMGKTTLHVPTGLLLRGKDIDVGY